MSGNSERAELITEEAEDGQEMAPEGIRAQLAAVSEEIASLEIKASVLRVAIALGV